MQRPGIFWLKAHIIVIIAEINCPSLDAGARDTAPAVFQTGVDDGIRDWRKCMRQGGVSAYGPKG